VEIRKAELTQLEEIKAVYARAREFMANTGNPDQWGKEYPPEETIRADIASQELYVVMEEGKVVGVFFFTRKPDPDYDKIEDGAWENDLPHGVIHRVASSGTVKGVFPAALAYCKAQIGNIRMDTHPDNKVMQHVLTKNGFAYCGIVYVRGVRKRLAYQYVE